MYDYNIMDNPNPMYKAFLAGYIWALLDCERERVMEIVGHGAWIMSSKFSEAWMNRIIETRQPKSDKWFEANENDFAKLINEVWLLIFKK